MSSLADIPPELKRAITGYLSPQEAKRLRLVSSKWEVFARERVFECVTLNTSDHSSDPLNRTLLFK